MSKLFKTKNFIGLIWYLVLPVAFLAPLITQANGFPPLRFLTVWYVIYLTPLIIIIYLFFRILLKRSVKSALFFGVIIYVILMLFFNTI